MKTKFLYIIIALLFIHDQMYASVSMDDGVENINENTPVSISENDQQFILSNGFVSTKISKKSGSIISIVYNGVEVLAGESKFPCAMWSHDASSEEMMHKITINPDENNGTIGEVSIKGISNNLPMGNGPGGSFIADIEIRYALKQGESGIYTYSIFDHTANYKASAMGEARFVAFLDRGFDWISVDEKRNKYYPLEKNGLDLSKYQLTANQYKNPAFGWINTSKNIGFWLINSSMEYMSGGPTKNEFLCHRDTKVNGVPCVLNYWRSSHYGGSSLSVNEGEAWTKVIGPLFIYLNKGTGVENIKLDVQQKAVSEQKKWPYAWVDTPVYPLKKDRGTVEGKLKLIDTINSSVFKNLWVGLSAPDYPVTRTGSENLRMVDWQYDAKYYQFWDKGDASGKFNIENVRPGKYTLHAFSDGVLGEFIKTDIDVVAGGEIDLGSLEWFPVRFGVQLWDIGIANRNGSEFLGGDRFYEYDIVKKYPHYFPEDVNYIIGKSDYSKDWFFEHIPHVENPDAPEANAIPERSVQALIRVLGINSLEDGQKQIALKTIEELGNSGKYADGKSTTWKIQFTLPEKIKGDAILRLAICGIGVKTIDVEVNNVDVGYVEDLRIDGTPNRSGSSGMWLERKVVFDASLFKKGNNILSLTIPEGKAVNGIMYDYLRLEHVAEE